MGLTKTDDYRAMTWENAAEKNKKPTTRTSECQPEGVQKTSWSFDKSFNGLNNMTVDVREGYGNYLPVRTWASRSSFRESSFQGLEPSSRIIVTEMLQLDFNFCLL